MQETEKKPLETVEEHILTEMQRRFCDFYIETGKGTEAAIRAGYSKKTAYKIASVNLTKPYIKAYIDKRLKEMADARIADATEVMEYLTKVLRGETESEVVVIEGTGDGCSEARTLSKTPDEKERLKAAELIGKRHGMFTEKVKFDGALPVIICGGDQLEE